MSLGLPTAPAYTPLTATIPPHEGESGSPHYTCLHATHYNYSTTGRRVWVSPLHLCTCHSLQLFYHRKVSLGLPTAPAYTPLTATIPPQEGECGVNFELLLVSVITGCHNTPSVSMQHAGIHAAHSLYPCSIIRLVSHYISCCSILWPPPCLQDGLSDSGTRSQAGPKGLSSDLSPRK